MGARITGKLDSPWAQLTPRAPPPPQERMRPILFCSWDLSEHEKWMPQPLNWMDYLYSAIFQMAASEEKLRFRLLLRISRIDRDKISVSKSMFFWMKNPRMTLKSPYDSICPILS